MCPQAKTGEDKVTMRARKNRLASSAAAALVALALASTLIDCKNILADEVATLQQETVSPVISILASNVAVADGGSLSFGVVSTTSYGDLSLTIANKGKKNLVIDVAGIRLTPDSSTSSSAFVLNAGPSATVSSTGSTTLTIRFTPVTEGAMSATLTIPTNDIQTPSFKCKLTGSGWAVSLSTAAVSSVNWTSAVGGGNITDSGSASITERGICWGTSPNPTVADGKCADVGIGSGSFTCALSGLLPGTFYYVRAYASVGNFTVYGLSTSLTTTAPTLPITTTITAINATSATSGCTATADTGVTLLECGVCWSTAANPTTAGSHASGTSGTSIGLSGLSLATTYYLRAYAILKSGAATKTIYASGDSSMRTVGYTDSDGYYVFYDAGSVQTDATYGNWRYMIAAPSDMGTSNWSTVDGTLLGATATAIGTGKANTTTIVNALGSSSVSARACTTATFGGYTDWFLPSRDELNLMMLNLAQKGFTGFGAFNTTYFYWSSTEATRNAAYYQYSDSTTTGNSQLKVNCTIGLTRAARRVTVLP